MLFHAVGLRLNIESQQNCQKSFNDIKRNVKAKIEMQYEAKKQTQLMESVIPHHLVARMREDQLSPQNEDKSFRRIYMDSYENVSILFADIVNFTIISSNCNAQDLVQTLNELFGRFDQAADVSKSPRIYLMRETMHELPLC